MNSSTNEYVLKEQTKEIIWNVMQFMIKEAEEAKNKVFRTDRFLKVAERTSLATGASRKTISRILHEKKLLDSISTGGTATRNRPLFKTPKKGKFKKLCLLDLDDFVYQDIRRKVYDYQLIEKQVVTLRLLLTKLQMLINYTGGRETLRKILKELGFQMQNKSKLFIENDHVRLVRLKYINDIKTYRKEGRNIVYGLETKILSNPMNKPAQTDGKPISKSQKFILLHAGGTSNLISNTLLIYEFTQTIGNYHGEMTKEKYEKWLQEKLIPSLQPHSVFVIDNLSYQRTLEQNMPNADATLWSMQEWLKCKKIYFEENELKSDLYNVIKMHKNQYLTYSLDTIMETHGHKVLRLPPHNPDLNPMEYIWLQVKDYVGNQNIELNIDRVKHLVNEKFLSLGPIEWCTVMDHAILCEDYFLKLEESIVDGLDKTTINNIDLNCVHKISLTSESEPEGSPKSPLSSDSESSDISDSSSDDYIIITDATEIKGL